jgi:hypothetical protein
VPASQYYFNAKRPLAIIYLKTIFEAEVFFEGNKSYFFRYDEENPGPKKVVKDSAMLAVGPLKQMSEAQALSEIRETRVMGVGKVFLADTQPDWAPFDFYQGAGSVDPTRMDATSPRVKNLITEEAFVPVENDSPAAETTGEPVVEGQTATDACACCGQSPLVEPARLVLIPSEAIFMVKVALHSLACPYPRASVTVPVLIRTGNFHVRFSHAMVSRCFLPSVSRSRMGAFFRVVPRPAVTSNPGCARIFILTTIGWCSPLRSVAWDARRKSIRWLFTIIRIIV